jgi:hypothetical protein
MPIGVTDEAAATLRALLRHNPALPGRLARVVMDDAGALGVELTDAPGAGDAVLRPGLLAGPRAAAALSGALLPAPRGGGGWGGGGGAGPPARRAPPPRARG